MAKTTFGKVVALLFAGIILCAMFTGCTEAKEKTPEEEFSYAKEEVSAIRTQNFYCFKEFIKNVVLEEEGIDVEDLFIKIDNDNTVTVHVLSTNQEYQVYTLNSVRISEITHAFFLEENIIYLSSHDDNGEEIYVHRSFDETIWNSWYKVEGEHIFFEP